VTADLAPLRALGVWCAHVYGRVWWGTVGQGGVSITQEPACWVVREFTGDPCSTAPIASGSGATLAEADADCEARWRRGNEERARHAAERRAA
jgi:hypothetical protein